MLRRLRVGPPRLGGSGACWGSGLLTLLLLALSLFLKEPKSLHVICRCFPTLGLLSMGSCFNILHKSNVDPQEAVLKREKSK